MLLLILECLHVQMHQQIIDGVHVGGGIEHAQSMVTAGTAQPQDFRFMLQLCGWLPGQLQSEVMRIACIDGMVHIDIVHEPIDASFLRCWQHGKPPFPTRLSEWFTYQK